MGNKYAFFYNLVRGHAEIDLKNRAQFKTNSTYIFEGEIVDSDALGNIVYGYLGKYFGFPENVLLVGGGFAQNQAKTTSDNFKYFNADDPKDQFRILQGMLMYDDSISSSYSNQHKNKSYELNIISKVNQYII